jgi:hypothetical protein
VAPFVIGPFDAMTASHGPRLTNLWPGSLRILGIVLMKVRRNGVPDHHSA